jgi:hypothetical protein
MSQPSDQQCLIFNSNLGSFKIQPEDDQEKIFTLHFKTSDNNSLNLGQYCSISDAIGAVSRQETGSPEWDQLDAQQIPLRVHNIASWKFQKYTGTLPHVACS